MNTVIFLFRVSRRIRYLSEMRKRLFSPCGGYFNDQVLAKRRLLPNAAEGGTLFFFCVWRLHAELTKNNWSHSPLFYKLERNIVK